MHDINNGATAAAAKLQSDMHVTFEMPYNIELTNDPFDNHTHRMVTIKPTDVDQHIGMILRQCTEKKLPQLVDCKKGSSMMKVQRWRSELRHAYITHVNGLEVHSINDVAAIIRKARAHGEMELKLHFATMEKQAMHPQFGIPQLYHDQLNIIGEHLWEIKNNPDWNKSVLEELVVDIDDGKAMRQYPNYGKKKLGCNRLYSKMHALPTWIKIKAVKKRKSLPDGSC